MSGKFQFSLQPKLDQLGEEKSACELALKKAKDALEEKEAAKRALEDEAQRLSQQLLGRADNHGGARGPSRPAYELIGEGQTYDTWSGRINAVRAQVAERQTEVDFAASVVRVREQELADVLTSLQAMERLKDRQRSDWLRELDDAQQADLDDASIAAWNRRRAASGE